MKELGPPGVGGGGGGVEIMAGKLKSLTHSIGTDGLRLRGLAAAEQGLE